MKTVGIIEGLGYPEFERLDMPEHHRITCEIAARLQELDELMTGDENYAPGGIRFINRLGRLERRSRRAYRLILDILGGQESLSLSLESLAQRHTNKQGLPSSRQSWLQNAQADIKIIKEVWPDIGNVLEEIMKRRANTPGEL